MLDILTTAVKSHQLPSQSSTPISQSRLQLVIKMNSLGFYARTYIDALNVAFAPLSTAANASQKTAHAVQGNRAEQMARAKAAESRLARAA